MVDLDGTLCEGRPYEVAVPIKKNIGRINSFYLKGNHIVIWTSRGMITYEKNQSKIEYAYREMTERWLRENGVKFHELRFMKPVYDKWIDDKAEKWK